MDLTLAGLPRGLQKSGGILFDVWGIVQLRRAAPDWNRWAWLAYPETVTIRVGRAFNRLHVLHATAYPDNPHAVVGTYVLHYSDGQQQTLEISCGHDLDDWVEPRDSGRSAPKLGEATVAWRGEDPFSAGRWRRLFLRTHTNPRPSQQVVSLDFKSAMTQSAPFLVALTVE